LPALAVLLAAVLPAPALAHTAERGFVMLLPTGYYLTGGALAVALSFTALALAPDRWLRRAFVWRRRWCWRRTGLARFGDWLAFGAFLLLLQIGLAGARDPLANLLPLAVRTLGWVGLTLLAAVLGNLWHGLNPWSAPLRLLRPLAGPPLLRLPSRLGLAPAILGLFLFGWFELVDLAPEDPARLARAAGCYWLLCLVAMLLFGARAWRAQGEFLSVFFALIGRLAPLRCVAHGRRRLVELRLPGAGLVRGAPLPPSAVVFVLLVLATVSFDGLNKTFWWLDLIGVNPLAFPGRSAVMAANTLGLLATALVLNAAFAAAVLAGLHLAGARPGRGELARHLGRLVLSILPIALAYHFSHYLTNLLVNGQYALAALSDPLGRGADLLGIEPFYVTTSFLNARDSVERIWQAQAGAIVVGHLLAVLVAHRIALDLHGDRRRAALSQLPLAVLMVAYTFFGLWLLASPVAG
jgi:hypothetical protein